MNVASVYVTHQQKEMVDALSYALSETHSRTSHINCVMAGAEHSSPYITYGKALH